jgi:hypothetical protein
MSAFAVCCVLFAVAFFVTRFRNTNNSEQLQDNGLLQHSKYVSYHIANHLLGSEPRETNVSQPSDAYAAMPDFDSARDSTHEHYVDIGTIQATVNVGFVCAMLFVDCCFTTCVLEVALFAAAAKRANSRLALREH